MEGKMYVSAAKSAQLLETIDTLQKEKECWLQIESYARSLQQKTENLSPEQQKLNEQETGKMLLVCAEQCKRLDRLLHMCFQIREED